MSNSLYKRPRFLTFIHVDKHGYRTRVKERFVCRFIAFLIYYCISSIMTTLFTTYDAFLLDQLTM